jgi:capsular polysaccharide biosynthesis protein
MSEPADSPRNDLSLMELLGFLGRHTLILAIYVVIFTVGAGALAFSLKPMYRSEVVVSPAEGSSGLGGELGGQLGGLVSLAGINIGGAGGKKSDEALEYLRSRIFTAGFIQHHALMPILFAREWDSVRNQWRDPDDVPTIAEGIARFSKKVRQVTEDKRTGIVTVSIIWSDRVTAAQWANWLIAEADKALRDRAIAEQNRSIEYLRSEAAQTSSVEIGNAISKLMETELKNAMVARTRDAYAFKVVDPAVVADPKDRDSPNKPLIVVMGAGLGFVIGVIAAAVRQRRRARR